LEVAKFDVVKNGEVSAITDWLWASPSGRCIIAQASINMATSID